MSKERSFKSIRKMTSGDRTDLAAETAKSLKTVNNTPAFQNLQKYLYDILLADTSENNLEALLADKGRKSLARDLLQMFEDETNEELPTQKPS